MIPEAPMFKPEYPPQGSSFLFFQLSYLFIFGYEMFVLFYSSIFFYLLKMVVRITDPVNVV